MTSDFTPDVVTDQTSAHDLRVGYIPTGTSVEEAERWRARDATGYENAVLDSMAVHVEAMLALQRRGAVAFDYGNNIRGQVAEHRGLTRCIRHPWFCSGVMSGRCSAAGPDRSAGLLFPAILGTLR